MPQPVESRDPSSMIPPVLDKVIGNEHVVRRLKTAVEAAWADNKPLDHVLMTGPAGVGKTAISRVLAAEMAGGFVETTGQAVWHESQLNGLFISIQDPNSVVFIDEAHMLQVGAQTALLKIIDDRTVYLAGSSGDERATKIDLVPFSVVLATTDPHRLLPTLRDRMRLICQLQRYGPDDLVAILRQKAAQLGWSLEEAILRPIAVRSFGTPRLALRLLESVRRTTRAEGETVMTMAHAERTFELEQCDSIGLGADERAYLSILVESSEPVRLHVIACRLGQPPEAISSVTESNLVWLGLIDRTERGRCLTARGLQHVRGLVEPD